jgi:hypothetical protein
MKSFRLAAVLMALALPAQAQCFADYKAKMDDPLRLHYGVVEVSDCGTAKAEVMRRLAANGWTLLTILSTFGPEGLDKRKDNAGEYFLRF